ncbi:MAG TPA: M13 family metallopeptidase, partial [Aquella sp.]|nr:M13 family metallopeptidase [Aquella sp.]
LVCFMASVTAQSAANNKMPPASQNSAFNQNTDLSVLPQEDFFNHANGIWLKNAAIPDNRALWGVVEELEEHTTMQLKERINYLAGHNSNNMNSNEQKVYALYTSFMNEQLLESLGIKPLEEQISTIDKIKNKKQISQLIANLGILDVTVPISIDIGPDQYDSTKEVVFISQGELGLPDRDYYLNETDSKLTSIKQKYLKHIETVLEMSGDKHANQNAKAIMDLETKLAKIQWTNVENDDPEKTYNKFKLSDLPQLMPNYNWDGYLKAAKLNGKVKSVIIEQPSYFTKLDKILQQTPINVWKVYFKWHLLDDYSPLLSKSYDNEHFAFYDTILSGIIVQKPRDELAIAQIEDTLGDALGKLYITKYFPPENKTKIEKLAENIVGAFGNSIVSLDWMTDATKAKAREKLGAMKLKIAYPEKWEDFQALEIQPNDLVGNVMRANEFEYQREIGKLGKAVDRTEWFITPQTVSAYYDPEQNEIVLPAAILQSPFFNVNADDAINYGGIGAVIGHEISHGFDDLGSQYDKDGNLSNWWTKKDAKNFAAKTEALVKQYSKFSPLPGYSVDGELTLGENIADNSGLAVAYRAYRESLHGLEAPVINGITGDQRFYYSFAETWREKVREPQIIQDLKVNPHSPPKFRVNGTLMNQPGFDKAFNVQPGNAMYLPAGEQVIIW